MKYASAMGWGAVLAFACTAPATAAGPTAATAPETRPVPSLPAAEPDRGHRSDVVGQVPFLAESDLDAYRAGETLVAGNQTLTAVTTGNTLTGNYTSGAVTLSDSALANFSGIGNFAINTGAQVSIQSGMNLTINVSP